MLREKERLTNGAHDHDSIGCFIISFIMFGECAGTHTHRTNTNGEHADSCQLLQTHYCKYILFHLTFYTRRLRPSNQRWRRPQQRHLLCRAVTRSTRTLTDADANGSTFTENRTRTENSFDRFFSSSFVCTELAHKKCKETMAAATAVLIARKDERNRY